LTSKNLAEDDKVGNNTRRKRKNDKQDTQLSGYCATRQPLDPPIPMQCTIFSIQGAFSNNPNSLNL
jgi:hypothetical protein